MAESSTNPASRAAPGAAAPALPPMALLLVALLLMAPLLLVDVPPLLDYPNHLARLFLLAQGGDDPVLAPMFSVHWAIIPNLAIDLAGPPLLRVLPVHVAGRALVALALLLPFLGAVAYSRALFGRAEPWSLAAMLVAFDAGLLLGFLNFQLGIGLALLAASGWIRHRERRPAACMVLGGAAMAGIFFCHLMGVLFALMLIGAHELARAWQDRGYLRRGLALLPLVAIPAALYLASALDDHAARIEYLSPAGKLAQLLWPFTTYNLPLDLLAAGGVVGFLAVARPCVPASSAIALAALAALYVVTPYAFKGTQSLDARFTLMLALLLFAGVAPRPPRWLAAPAAAGFAVLAAARIAVVALAWHGHAASLAELRQTLAPLAPGDRVLVASVAPSEAPDWWDHMAPLAFRLSNGIRTDTHLPALALIERRAFWPLLFDAPSQQPVLWTPRWQALADQAGSLIDHRALRAGQTCGYSHLLLLDAAADPAFAIGTRLVATPTATLFALPPCRAP
jgi:hypothetical protein